MHQQQHGTLIIGKLVITQRICVQSDYKFVFGLVKKMIFPFVKEYFSPDKKMFDERFAKDYGERTILMRGKRRIGFYQTTPVGDQLNLTGIFLSDTYQGKGIGTHLMRHLETRGFRTIRLQVWENNPAVHFYKKLGYTIITKRNHKYTMEKVCN